MHPMQEIQGRQIGAGGWDVTAPTNELPGSLPAVLHGDATADMGRDLGRRGVSSVYGPLRTRHPGCDGLTASDAN